MLRTFLIASTLLVAAACGGNSKPATATTPAGEHAGGEHHDLPAEVAAFHDKLAPLWHADAGQSRTDTTCTATGELDQLAEGVQNAAPPAGVDGAAWSEKVTALRERITQLSAGCGGTDHATFDANFEAVHKAFHHLIELLPATEGDKAASGESEHHG